MAKGRQYIGEIVKFRLPDVERERLENYCKVQHMSVAEVGRSAMKMYLDRVDRDTMIETFIDQSDGSQYGQLMQCLQNFMFEVDTIQRASNE